MRARGSSEGAVPTSEYRMAPVSGTRCSVASSRNASSACMAWYSFRSTSMHVARKSLSSSVMSSSSFFRSHGTAERDSVHVPNFDAQVEPTNRRVSRRSARGQKGTVMPGFSVRLEVAAGVRETVGLWSAAGDDEGVAVLRVLMDLGQQAIDDADRLVRRHRLRAPFAIGRLAPRDVTPPLVHAMELAERSRPIELRSPFEDCPTIAGGLWAANQVFETPREDGLAKLRFAAGTNDLPAHVHEHSDRCLYVLEGEGLFHASPCDWRVFDGTGIESVPVRAGDVVVFNRGVLHTFSAPLRELVLVSYHSPALAFDDPRQFTVPRVAWIPSHSEAAVSRSCKPRSDPVGAMLGQPRYDASTGDEAGQA